MSAQNKCEAKVNADKADFSLSLFYGYLNARVRSFYMYVVYMQKRATEESFMFSEKSISYSFYSKAIAILQTTNKPP